MSQESNQLIPNRILQTLVNRFSLSDLKLLCFNLGIDYEELPGETKTDKARELILFMQRHGRLSELEKAVNTWPFKKTTKDISSPLKQRDKSLGNLLRLVQTTWIEGVLYQSLQSAVLLQLDLTHTPDAITRSQPYVLKQKGEMDMPVPVEQTIDELFEAHGRNLLILGEPGSGKTFTMLQLAEVLMQQAEVDPRLPVPVVLNLASWAKERKSLVEWIVDGLGLQYQVPRKLGRGWLENNELLLLLDGLDEVDADYRDDCIVAINSFKATHAANVVVCSRIAEYVQLQERLNLSTAVTIQPLTEAEIDRYLAQEGLELQAVRATLKHDKDMRVLVQSPLMLTIMTLAYRGMSVEELRHFASIEARRDHLFSEYVARVFERRPLPDGISYDQPQALQWLTYLAAQMTHREQTVFFIERLQPGWLFQVSQGRLYRLFCKVPGMLLIGLSMGLFYGLYFGVIFGLIFDLLGMRVFGLSIGLFIGLSMGLIFGLLAGEVIASGSIEPYEKVIYSWKGGLFGGLTCGLMGGMIGWQYDGLMSKLSAGLSIGLILDLIFGRLFSVSFELEVESVLIGGLFGGLIGGLFGGLFDELTNQWFEFEGMASPNQGIWQSGKNAIYISLILALIIGSIGMLFFWLLGGLIIGSVGMLIFGLIFGGAAFIRHFVLRFFLWWYGYLPGRQLVPFLDEMAARILLRKVGGGYIFIHRTLQDYFAERYEIKND